MIKTILLMLVERLPDGVYDEVSGYLNDYQRSRELLEADYSGMGRELDDAKADIEALQHALTTCQERCRQLEEQVRKYRPAPKFFEVQRHEGGVILVAMLEPEEREKLGVHHIEAIKMLRERSNIGLIDAKNAADYEWLVMHTEALGRGHFYREADWPEITYHDSVYTG